jgi:Ran GTPase-activating protein (RanGAP) involved in mRNA processing and transport
VKILSKFLEGNTQLKGLSIKGNKINAQGFTQLLQVLPSTKVKMLDFRSNEIKEGDIIPWEQLSSNTLEIESLLLGDNCPASKPPSFTDPLFWNIPTSIVSLDLSRCKLNDQHVDLLCETLNFKLNKLIYLDLSSNYLTSRGGHAIGRILSTNCTLKWYFLT